MNFTKQLWRIMKLTTFIIILFILQVSASTNAQISINEDAATLSTVLETISKQSGYDFIYSDRDVKGLTVTSIRLTNVGIEKALEECFKGQPLLYQIADRTVMIKRKKNILSKALSADVLRADVRGRVTDESGKPLPDVSVRIKGMNSGTATAANGEFSIQAESGKTLVFTLIGYQPHEVIINGNDFLNIQMTIVVNALTDVVITGYGSQKRSDIISSIGTANVKDMQLAPVKSFEEALAGRIAGVRVTSSEGGPLASNSIVIRGNSSLTQDNSPLWIVDGFPLENPNNNAVNPDDIESITVLKDAASTAIYGSRGANGVILVTTKKGKTGNSVIAFNSTFGFQKTLKQMEMLNAYDYVVLQNEMVGQSAVATYTPGDPSLVGSPLHVPGGRTIDYYLTQPQIDWQGMLFKTAPFQTYSLSLSGGSEKTRYLVSGSITDQDGTILKTGFKRYQGRVVLNQEVNSKVDFSLNVNYANVNTRGGSPSAPGNTTSSLLYSVWGYRPAISPNSSFESQLNEGIDPDGAMGYNYNPVISNENTTLTSNANIISANSYFDYRVIKNLTLRVSGGLNHVQTLGNTYYGLNTYQGMPGSVLGPNGSISNNASTSLLNENTLTYSKLFNQTNSLEVLAGFSQQATKTRRSLAAASKVPNDVLGTSGLDEGTPSVVGAGSSNNFLASFFGRVNYNYKSKYYLSGTLRSDGSSKFATGNKWGYFPSAAAAWNVASEPFLKKAAYVSLLKLRASYGVSGNNRVDDFAYLSPINLNNIMNMYSYNGVYYKSATQPTLGNRGLKWETTATIDIGLDLGLFKNRVELTADYYQKKTTDLLLQATIPGELGYTTAIQNVGSVSNSGWEFTLNTVNLAKTRLTWNTNFNIAFNSNKLLALSSGQSGLVTSLSGFTAAVQFPYIAQLNGPISQYYGYKWIGNYQYEDFNKLPNGTYVLKPNVSANGNTAASIRPGDIKYEDINLDGQITAADQIVIGNPNPLFTGGFSNSFGYGGFDLNVLFTFSYKGDIMNANRLIFESAQGTQNQFATYADRWRPDNPTNLYPRAGGNTQGLISSRVIEDGSFLRLSTVSLGYNLPQKLMSRANIKNARLFTSAQNLFVLSRYKGSDPEVSTRSGALTPGFDYAAYPRAFTLTFGLNFSF